MKMKSKEMTTLHLRKSIGFLIPLAFVCLALCVSPRSRGDAFCNDLATTHWVNPGTGDWFDPLNWVLDINGQHTVPSSVSPTLINNGGTAQINTTTQTAYACFLALGANSGNSGTLSVDDGTLNASSNISVGSQGKGTLNITNGGAVSNPVASYIAALSGSNGSVTVDGQNQQGTKSQWTITGGVLYVGGTNGSPGGTGLLTVTNGGTVSAGDTVQVFNSGTLTGNGTVSTTNGTTVDGTVAPKGGGTTLTFGGNLTLNSGNSGNNGATTLCNVTPQDPSTTPQVSVSGQVSLGGRLSVTMTGDFTSAPTRFTLLNAGSVAVGHRTFDSTSITYPTNQCWTPQIDYVTDNDGYHVYLDRIVCAN
jgi:T5SS/PEP-CTERM-associated repeat protein